MSILRLGVGLRNSVFAATLAVMGSVTCCVPLGQAEPITMLEPKPEKHHEVALTYAQSPHVLGLQYLGKWRFFPPGQGPDLLPSLAHFSGSLESAWVNPLVTPLLHAQGTLGPRWEWGAFRFGPSLSFDFWSDSAAYSSGLGGDLAIAYTIHPASTTLTLTTGHHWLSEPTGGWSSAWRLGLDAHYRLAEQWTLKAGYRYQQAPEFYALPPWHLAQVGVSFNF